MDASYQNFTADTDDSEDTPHENVKIHVPPTTKVTRWSHIEDLDLFFTRLYTYHQKHGFNCIIVDGLLELIKVIFVLWFCLFLLYFIDYDILFHRKVPESKKNNTFIKITFDDFVCSFEDCVGNINALTWICIFIVSTYWMFRFIKLTYNLYHYWDIKAFFNMALGIKDKDLLNITWNDVQKKICEVQLEYKMCIRKNELTELDIYHRILRSKNYMVAMVNKSILPLHHNIPSVGNVTYLSYGLRYNMELLFFSGTWGFFENWHLKEDYKKVSKRHELAAKLQRNITWFAVVNLFLGIFIFLWQLVYFFFNYAELLKREPGLLTLRCWSQYARQYLRHFNELDHELEARLKRAYKPASRYMNSFSSPMLCILAETVVFVSGAVLVVLTALTVYDEDVITVEYYFTIVAVLTGLITGFKGFMPDETICWCPETLMIEILTEVHYLPDSWRGATHTTIVRNQFAQFFQYKATYLLFELISPLLTPLIFYFKLRPRSLEIIDFYRNFTVSVLGVGDVCSFSLMDMRRHGNPGWQSPGSLKCPENNKQTQAEDGKTELSLIHFATMNPTWHPPEEAEEFIHEVKEKSRLHDEKIPENDKHHEALETVSVGLSMIIPQTSAGNLQFPAVQRVNHSCGYRLEGPTATTSYYFNPVYKSSDSFILDPTDRDTPLVMMEDPAVNMSISTLYLHSLHHKYLVTSGEHTDMEGGDEYSINRTYSSAPSAGCIIRGRKKDNASEGTPLLSTGKST